MKAKKVGRPPGPRENVRRNRLGISVTDAERKQLERWAAEEGRPVGVLLHGIVKRALERRG